MPTNKGEILAEQQPYCSLSHTPEAGQNTAWCLTQYIVNPGVWQAMLTLAHITDHLWQASLNTNQSINQLIAEETSSGETSSVLFSYNICLLFHFRLALFVNGLHFAFTLPNIHPSIHTFTHRRRCQPCKVGVGVSLVQGHLNTQLGGAGDQTGNLPVARQPFLVPEPPASNWIEILAQNQSYQEVRQS